MRERTAWVVFAAAVMGVGTAGCENHLCDPSSASWGMTGGEGDIAYTSSGTYWESSPVDANYVPFPHQVTLTFYVSSFFPDCEADFAPLIYVSPDQNPAAVDGGNLASIGGNYAEIEPSAPGTLTVYNNSCADYYIRVAVTCPLRSIVDASAGTGDGAADSE